MLAKQQDVFGTIDTDDHQRMPRVDRQPLDDREPAIG